MYFCNLNYGKPSYNEQHESDHSLTSDENYVHKMFIRTTKFRECYDP